MTTKTNIFRGKDKRYGHCEAEAMEEPTASQTTPAWQRHPSRQAPGRPGSGSWVLSLLLTLALPLAVEAQFAYTAHNGSATITGYSGAGGALSIPWSVDGLPITSIGANAFAHSTNVTSVTIPDWITNIGSYAFNDCSSMTKVTIGNGITSIRNYTFANCTNLSNVSFPDSVTEIQDSAFYSCSSLTNVTIPGSVTNIGHEAFAICRNLTGVYCKGNPPSADPSAFASNTTATVYYLPGSSGWGAAFAGRPTVMWNPQVQASDASFGVQTNQFGFTITGTSNMLVVVEASGSLSNPLWSSPQTITLASGSAYFSDPLWKYFSRRFYRLRMP